jgi:transposase
MEARERWLRRVALTDLQQIVFLDETGAKTNMTRLYGRAQRGRRVKDHTPHGHWKTTTLVATVGCMGASAPMVLDGSMDGAAFEAYVEQVLCPTLKPGMIVVMDNLRPHKTSKVLSLVKEVGADIWFLPPYSPDLNPIELMWSKVKTYLRAIKARSKEGLWEAIGHALDTVTKEDSEAWFRRCCVGIIN